MTIIKTVSRVMSSVVPGKERRKEARLKIEDGLCAHKKFELLLVVFGGTVGKCSENVKVYAAEFPCEGYSYMDKKIKFTKAGYHFEEPFVRCCREEVIKLTEKENA